MEDLKRELYVTVDNWVKITFNFIHIDVIEAIIEKEDENNIYDYIESLPVNSEDIINNYSLLEEFEEYLTEKEIDKNKLLIKDLESLRLQFLEDCHQEYIDEIQDNNYPIWNTCFEQRNQWDKLSEVALKHGCGIINKTDYFNDVIFMMSAGHSFYSSYWIPIYLDLYPQEAKKYIGVNYSDL